MASLNLNDLSLIQRVSYPLSNSFIEEFYKQIKMPTRLSDLNFKEESFKEVAYNYTFKGKRVLEDRVLIDYDKDLEILYIAK